MKLLRIIFMFLTVSVFALFAITFSGCGTLSSEMGTTSGPGKEEIKAETLYKAKCSSCHQLLQVKNYDANKLIKYMNKYGKAMTDEEKQTLTEYFQSNRN